ncbi:hypothetical protein [endosymbiont of unidentified scaly snail isolate Monju]|uniref:hypothetical protein n=1 Tax=endosymbiont of unidentified scaly snail isolate Monju TaxID=1248727 RepID=UPI00038924FF|nr:hypothetical protein [endosymbiont of unidentified scaly snail isolate Monju]BAN68694.1 hypothetical protein EBS_0745 [endosymbiont of unidentified scaly snail isolate Monju]
MDIPQPLIARHPDAIVNVRELRSWLEELPPTNPKYTIQQLQRQLAFLVRDPQPARRYEELLRCYHEPVATLQTQALDALGTQPVARTRNQRDLLEPFPGLLQENWPARTCAPRRCVCPTASRQTRPICMPPC